MQTDLGDDLDWLGGTSSAASEMRAANSLTAMTSRVVGARSFPDSARQLVELTQSEKYDVAHAASLIEGDAPLCARVLRMVNSPAFGLQERCKSVKQAVALLGSKHLRSIAVAAAAVLMFPEQSAASEPVRRHMSGVATVARHLAPLWGLDRDEVFTCGLLHDIGILMLLTEGGATYAATLEGGPRDEVHLRERQTYGFDHGVLGAHVLKAWMLPHPLPRVVSLHHDSGRAYEIGGQIASIVAVLRLADQMVHTFEEGRPFDAATLAKVEPAAYLELNAERLALLVDECKEVYGHGKGMLDEDKSAAREEDIDGRLACFACGKPTFGEACPRCGQPVCDAHTPERGLCCHVCEEAFERYRRERLAGDLYLRLAIASIVPFVGLLVLGPVLRARGVATDLSPWIGLSAGLLVLFAIAAAFRRWRLRADFVLAKPAASDAQK